MFKAFPPLSFSHCVNLSERSKAVHQGQHMIVIQLFPSYEFKERSFVFLFCIDFIHSEREDQGLAGWLAWQGVRKLGGGNIPEECSLTPRAFFLKSVRMINTQELSPAGANT